MTTDVQDVLEELERTTGGTMLGIHTAAAAHIRELRAALSQREEVIQRLKECLRVMTTLRTRLTEDPIPTETIRGKR